MKIVIIDTGCANLLSVKFAIERLGYEAQISFDKYTIAKADKLILPGVGSASLAMSNLKARNLIDIIRKIDKPLLGICLGMQLFADFSQEGNIKTLSIINVEVQKIPEYDLPLPHIGWNLVKFLTNDVLFDGISDNSYFYFVHSYEIVPCKYTISTSSYGKAMISSIIKKDNFYGVQFHPEKSSKAGSNLLKNFIEKIC